MNTRNVPDLAQGDVLPEYTDEGLASGVYGHRRVGQLRELPPEWRQNAMAEAHVRAYELKITYNRDGLGESSFVPRQGVSFEDALVGVIEDIKVQIRNT